jgi:hypothetical protein
MGAFLSSLQILPDFKSKMWTSVLMAGMTIITKVREMKAKPHRPHYRGCMIYMGLILSFGPNIL